MSAIGGTGSMMGASMGSALMTSASGLRDASLRLDVTANNVANLDTPDFQPARVTSAARADGSVTSVVTGVQVLGNSGMIPNATQPGGNGDFINEGVQLILARRAFEANARAVKAESDMTRSLIASFG